MMMMIDMAKKYLKKYLKKLLADLYILYRDARRNFIYVSKIMCEEIMATTCVAGLKVLKYIYIF